MNLWISERAECLPDGLKKSDGLVRLSPRSARSWSRLLHTFGLAVDHECATREARASLRMNLTHLERTELRHEIEDLMERVGPQWSTL